MATFDFSRFDIGGGAGAVKGDGVLNGTEVTAALEAGFDNVWEGYSVNDHNISEKIDWYAIDHFDELRKEEQKDNKPYDKLNVLEIMYDKKLLSDEEYNRFKSSPAGYRLMQERQQREFGYTAFTKTYLDSLSLQLSGGLIDRTKPYTSENPAQKTAQQEERIKKAHAELANGGELTVDEIVENLYPSSKYDRSDSWRGKNIKNINFHDEKTGEYFRVAEVVYWSNSKTTVINEYDKDENKIGEKRYNERGELGTYYTYNDNGATEHHAISDELYNDITAKNKFGLPTTGKDLEKHIMKINAQNIFDVLDSYKQDYGETLLNAIENEWGLDKNIKERVLAHLNKVVAETGLSNSNCKIDEDFMQGSIGDCWFLATIAAIKESPKGLEILNDTIKDNKDGTYTVKFKGTDKEYTVSNLEIVNNKNFARGDVDVRILEIAAQKHFTLGIKYGGNPKSAFDLLLGTNDKWNNMLRCVSPKPNKDKIKELVDNPNIVVTCSINPFSKLYGLIVRQIPDTATYKEEVATAHAYALTGIDDGYVYLKNLWDTSEVLSIPLKVFNDYWAYVQYAEIK